MNINYRMQEIAAKLTTLRAVSQAKRSNFPGKASDMGGVDIYSSAFWSLLIQEGDVESHQESARADYHRMITRRPANIRAMIDRTSRERHGWLYAYTPFWNTARSQISGEDDTYAIGNSVDSVAVDVNNILGVWRRRKFHLHPANSQQIIVFKADGRSEPDRCQERAQMLHRRLNFVEHTSMKYPSNIKDWDTGKMIEPCAGSTRKDWSD
ncbi:hypothetical protein B0H17DRAFT_1146366 [Mycena rosella]|uniref:Uncharacterized protein n=1 Tax=Mycena rosella TaxID=1033263 RepID=A0AAD7G4Y0_MYCRO|nr:hypothetical protein B0H17DRAFT_1146366 [Mycena rosella]